MEIGPLVKFKGFSVFIQENVMSYLRKAKHKHAQGFDFYMCYIESCDCMEICTSFV